MVLEMHGKKIVIYLFKHIIMYIIMESDKRQETVKNISKHIKLEKCDIKKDDIANKIEIGIYDFSIEYAEINEVEMMIESIYDTKVDEIIEGLDNNVNLVTTLEDAYKLASQESEKINPNKFEKLLKKKEIEEYKKNDIKSSTIFTCSKCKKSKCSVSQQQVKAGDEPATVFVKCLECGHGFSFS